MARKYGRGGVLKQVGIRNPPSVVSTVGDRTYKGRVKAAKFLGDLKPGDRVVGGLYGGERRGDNGMGTVKQVQSARAKGYKVWTSPRGPAPAVQQVKQQMS